MLHSFNDILGYTLRATDGEIGALQDVYFDESSTLGRYLVIDTGKWLPGRQVLLAPAALGGVDARSRQIIVGLTCQQVKDGPHVDSAKPVSRQHQLALHDYYSWELYWAVPPLAAGAAPDWGAAMPPGSDVAADATAAAVTHDDPKLRSAREVRGYAVRATDGAVGHVEDFLISDADWAIHLLVIDTRNWLPGRKVTISPRSLCGVDWVERRIEVDLTRERIEASPEFDPSTTPDQGQLRRLLEHYGLPFRS